ncbi:MAG: DegT/DnrJ/EryC1/StrS aminotransferase family protein, partial [Gammaproteobacteria bacterium]|nr:DegT/DnrJ/EryC1/StrS aminotransferase family protein [Gammaproteobacteria bacterium]
MFYQLPPAGNRIIWKQTLSSLVNIRKKVKPFDIFFYNSGAESLAAAIKSIVSCKEIDKPEVILSAYACPELVSAILYAGAKPVLIDVEYQRPWVSLSELREKISENTVAIIAVNLFGIPERLREISEICKQSNLCLIEDSAQAFPDISDNRFWQGDFIVLSFGRGKPVSTLGGGAVLCNNDDLKKGLPKEGLVFKYRKRVEFIQYRLKIFIYNLLLHPRLYFIPNSLPFLKLG